MSSERSMRIILWNHSNYTLTHFSGSATHGNAPCPDGLTLSSSGSVSISLAPGGSLAVVAKNSSGGCTGQFTVTDSNNHVSFPVHYDHPSSNDPTTLYVVPDSSHPSCMGVNDVGTLSGHDITVNMGLYQGCAVQEWDDNGHAYTAGYVAPLSATPYEGNNARDVVNSLFQTSIRKPDGVQHWFNQANAVPYLPADYTGGQLIVNGSASPPGALLQLMLNQWPGATTPLNNTPDWPLIQFLANFLVPETTTSSTPALVMYVPKFSDQGYVSSSSATGPKYQLLGYQAYPLAGSGSRFNMANVQTFLRLLLGGSHFVNIQADRDFQNQNPTNPPANTGRNLYDEFKSAFPAQNSQSGRHICEGNSHYTNTVNTSGWYYGNQMGEWAASDCGLLLSFLVAKTADNQYNTFMQLEGWPADNDWVFGEGSLSGGARHGGDYAAYKQSLWNISTFGAAPYSEKRGTTIFLAPASWVPTIYSNTYMMPYVGAETPQSWLETALVSVPSGTPSTPSQYG
ncbi:MAG: hypothetical protein R3F15_13490 [Lysobacterales bacterium]